MGRVLVNAWGPDSKNYVGKSLELYRDPGVTWAGMKVGGIRIRALSHIDAPFDMALTVTNKKKVIARFLHLKDAPAPQPEPKQDRAAAWAQSFMAKIASAGSSDALEAILSNERDAKALAKLEKDRPDLNGSIGKAIEIKRGTFASDDDWPDAPEPTAEPAASHALIAAIKSRADWRKASEHLEAIEGEVSGDDFAALQQALDDKRSEMGGA